LDILEKDIWIENIKLGSKFSFNISVLVYHFAFLRKGLIIMMFFSTARNSYRLNLLKPSPSKKAIIFLSWSQAATETLVS
jgi:hypothetical protein